MVTVIRRIVLHERAREGRRKIGVGATELQLFLPKRNIYGLLTKREVKMAGYSPSSFFPFLWTETKSRSINTQKTERGQYPAILTEQAWSIKDLLYGIKHQKNDL